LNLKWISWIWTWAFPKVKPYLKNGKPVVIPAGTPTTGSVVKQIIWSGFECLDWARHGDKGENQNRSDAIAAAISNGFDCLVIRLYPNMHGAWKIEVFHWESNVDKKKFVRSWTDRAMDAGIKKWVVIIPPSVTDASYVADCFKAYSPNTLQIVCDRATLMHDITASLGLDDQGVKVSEPRFR
jgi:hypothetical protein